MVNEYVMHLRSANSFLQIADDLPEQSCDDDALSDLSAAKIFKLVTRLPLGYRTVFNLFVLEGLSHKEIEFFSTSVKARQDHRKGEYFEETTFKFSLPGLHAKNILLEPEFIFNRFFKNFIPSLKLSLIFE